MKLTLVAPSETVVTFMNLALFIARRLHRTQDNQQKVSGLAVRIATLGVGIGVAVMILTWCVVLGFKHEISSKVIGFCSHIEVFNAQSTSSPESFAISATPDLLEKLNADPDITAVQRTSGKFGIIKTDTHYKGIQFRGIGKDYDTQFLQNHLKSGTFPDFLQEDNLNDILLGQPVAQEMGLKAGDKVFAYFFEDNIKVRRFHVAGIFSTDMQQFDENIIFAPLPTINQLNNWPDSLCSTLEIKVKDFDRLDDIHLNVLQTLRSLNPDEPYAAYTVRQLYSQIFDWLHLLDLNVWVILILMILLASLTIISGLLILILERTQTIGILKAMGSNNSTIRRTFLYYASFIVGRGLLLGYLIGLGLAIIQQKWHIITLNPEKYYVNHVPILFNWPIIIAIGAVTLIVCLIALVGPSYLISRIRPARTIKFE